MVKQWSNMVGNGRDNFEAWPKHGQTMDNKKHGQRFVKHGQTWGDPVTNWSTKGQNHQTCSEHSQTMIKQMIETWPRHGQHMANTISHTMVTQW